MVKYNKFFTDRNGLVYSVDMLRYNLKFNLDNEFKHKDGTVETVEGVEAFRKFIGQVSLTPGFDLRYYPNFKEFGYRHLWVIECVEWDSTLTLGLGKGTRKEENLRGFVEFNPNKVNGDMLSWFLDHVFICVSQCHLKRYDLAIDFPCARSLCRLDMNGLKTYHLIYENGAYTEYTGQRNKIGYVKLYDKKAESDLDYDLTRVEYTLDGNVSFDDLEPVLVSSAQMELLIGDTMSITPMYKLVIDLLIQFDAPLRNRYLKDIRSRERKKIEPFLQETALQLDKHCLRACLDFALSLTIA